MVLVLLRALDSGADLDHESFVDEMIAARVVAMGGGFTAGTYYGAYLLRVDDLAAAGEWVARDPLVRSGRWTAELLPWELVGVDAELLDVDS
jgi:hypothetical protein